MPKTAAPPGSAEIARFRLRRHHLLDEPPADPVTIARDMCGVQAQVMSAAYLQLWTRNHAITRAHVEDALWKTRTLVKTSLMRQTLHLIPSDEFPLYIAAQKQCRLGQALRVMARCGISREEGESLTPMIMGALSAGPLTKPAIAATLRPKVSKRVRAYMENVWSMIRLPVAEGLICYGRGESNEIVFIRLDHWLPQLAKKNISAVEAQCDLLRKYLRAYGPATLTDFSHWSGIPMQEVRELRPHIEGEVEEIAGEKKSSMLLREDMAALKKSSGTEACVRLLPIFDSYLLAHREKDHLLSAEHYKRVYRNQGWISSVVLVNGAIAGLWSYKLKNKKLLLEIEPFDKFSKATRGCIEREAKSLAGYFESGLKLKFA